MTTLEDAELIKEIREKLIVNLKVPVLSGRQTTTLDKHEVHFPTHIIGYLLLAMLNVDMLLQFQNVMQDIMDGMFYFKISLLLCTYFFL
jgi:hypothetical protein